MKNKIKNKLNKKQKTKQRDSLIIIANLLVSIIAIGFMIGIESEIVNASNPTGAPPKTDDIVGSGAPAPAPPPLTPAPPAPPVAAGAASPLVGAAPSNIINPIAAGTIVTPEVLTTGFGTFGASQIVATGTIPGATGNIWTLTKGTDGAIKAVSDTGTIIDKADPTQLSALNTKEAIGGTGTSSGGTISKLKNYFFGAPKSLMGGISQGLLWAGIAYTVIPWIGDFLGLKPETTKALQYGVSSGLFAYKLAQGLATKTTGIFAQGGGLGFIGANPALFGLGVGILVFILTYKKEKFETINFSCLPWEAPVGGGDCEKCNDGINPCSEYRCKSLGQACDIVNPGTDQEKCVWKNPKDVSSPIIRPWKEILTSGYKYTNEKPRPPSWGTELTKTSGGCIAAFTPIEFGIQTNKPSQCRIDFKLTRGFDDMQYYLGESNLYDYNHSQKMNIPNPKAVKAEADANNETTGGLTIENSKDYNLYIRCASANGYYNPDPYVVKFCVDDGPDATPPRIVEFNIPDGSPVQAGVDEVNIIAYTNEPANCKWSRLDLSYKDMENTMTCSNRIVDIQKNLLYGCSTKLTGVKDKQDNNYYFRCEDQPWNSKDKRNQMQTSKPYTLKGTQSLNIKSGSVKPISGETIRGATTTVEVNLELETENGYNKGEAECFYSSGSQTNYVPFFESKSYKHKQRQDLKAGTYTYKIQCIDLGGNKDTTNTTFSVFVDSMPPKVTRILYYSDTLKIRTDEDALCRFTNDPKIKCNFDLDGTEGSSLQYESPDNKKDHFAEWNTQLTYYIKCADDNGVQPSPTECSAIVKPVNVIGN